MRVTLRTWREEDIPLCAQYADNKKVSGNLMDVFPSPYTQKDAEDYCRFAMAGSDSSLIRAICVEDAFAGNISVSRQSDVHRLTAELGYWLAEPYWGNGIMSQAIGQICALAFNAWDIVRIYAKPFSFNRASCRVLEKSGFVREGILRGDVVKNGEICDSIMYSRIR